MDGACFGPALPHLFLLVYPEFLPTKKRDMTQTYLQKLEYARRTGNILPGVEGAAAESVMIPDDDDEPDPAIVQFGDLMGPSTNAGAGSLADPPEMTDEKRKDIERQRLINSHARKVQNIYQPTIDAVQNLHLQLFGTAKLPLSAASGDEAESLQSPPSHPSAGA